MSKEYPIDTARFPSSQRNIHRAGKRDGDENYVLVIHGGAGTMQRQNSTPEKRAEYRAALARALKAGYEVLKLGGEAIDAGIAAVAVMEDCPLFNAGKGSVFNIAGKNELEASLMLSKPPAAHPTIPPTRRGSSATLLTRTKNPSHLIRALYLSPALVPHPMLSGETAESLGAEHFGVEIVDPSYFWTAERWRQHRTEMGLPVVPVHALEARPESESESEQASDAETCVGSPEFVASESKYELDREHESIDLMPRGTVGAVALDIRGCIATVTSTGGRTNKLVGRIGDTPIMGSGFWSEEWECNDNVWKRMWDRWMGKDRPRWCGVGVSGTGDGDYFIRRNVASHVAHRMQYLDETVAEAAQHVVDDLLNEGGSGGVVAVDRQGNVTLPLNCEGMYRGVVRSDGVPLTAIFYDEELSEL